MRKDRFGVIVISTMFVTFVIVTIVAVWLGSLPKPREKTSPFVECAFDIPGDIDREQQWYLLQECQWGIPVPEPRVWDGQP